MKKSIFRSLTLLLIGILSMHVYAKTPVSVVGGNTHVLYCRQWGTTYNPSSDMYMSDGIWSGYGNISIRGISNKKAISNIKCSKGFGATASDTIYADPHRVVINVSFSGMKKDDFKKKHKITFTVNKNGKKYKFKVYVKIAKVPAPFSEVKIGNKDLTKQCNRQFGTRSVISKNKAVRISIKPKRGYTIYDITIQSNKDLNRSFKIKNGDRVRLKRDDCIIIWWRRKKPKYSYNMGPITGENPDKTMRTVIFVA